MARQEPADTGAFGSGAPVIDVPGLPVAQRGGSGASAAWAYSRALGELIAELYVDTATADGAIGTAGGLWGVHAAMPDRIPPPVVLAVWRQQFPDFGLLMAHAEKVRAERLMEEAVVIADTDPRAAPRVALSIAARQRLAESLDRARWGTGSRAGGDPPKPPGIGRDQPTAPELSDDELRALAAAGIEAGQAGGGSPP